MEKKELAKSPVDDSQGWKEVEQLKERIVCQEEKANNVGLLKTMTAVMASQIKSQQTEVHEET